MNDSETIGLCGDEPPRGGMGYDDVIKKKWHPTSKPTKQSPPKRYAYDNLANRSQRRPPSDHRDRSRQKRDQHAMI